MGSQKLPNEGEYPDVIGNHGEGVSLSHAILDAQEVAWLVPCVPFHQCVPVAVAVESKLYATRPLVTDNP